MDLRNKLFPHPVLSCSSDDFVDSSFDFKLEAANGINEIILTADFDLENEELQLLIDENKAEFLIHIECSYTFFRTTFRTSNDHIVKKIPEKSLDGKVSVCAFIIARENLFNYTNSKFNSDYMGLKFDLKRGSILAIGKQYNLNITKDIEDLVKIPSIFTICKSADSSDKLMKISIDGDKIAISLCESDFENYKLMSNIFQFLPVFHSMIILPSLIYTFDILSKEDLADYETRRWYVSIEKMLEKRGIELNHDTLDEIPSYELAQKLLDLPLNKALEAITSINSTDEDE